MGSNEPENKDDFDTKPQKGIPYYSETQENVGSRSHYGEPVSTRYMSNFTFFGIVIEDLTILPRVKRCALLSLINSALLFLTSMLLYSIWMVTLPTFMLVLVFAILAFGYFAFYTKKTSLFIAYLISCAAITITTIFSAIFLISTLSRYTVNNLPEGWTTGNLSKRNSTIWAVFVFSLVNFALSSYQLWYSYKAYKFLYASSLISNNPAPRNWQTRQYQDSYGANTQSYRVGQTAGYGGVVIGRTVIP